DLLAPDQELGDLVGALLVSPAHVAQAHGPRPPAVAIDDHADVPGDLRRGQLPLEPALIHLVDQIAHAHAGPLPRARPLIRTGWVRPTGALSDLNRRALACSVRDG